MEEFDKPKYQGIILVATGCCLADYTFYENEQKDEFDLAIREKEVNGLAVVNSIWVDEPLSLLNIDAIANKMSLEYLIKKQRR